MQLRQPIGHYDLLIAAHDDRFIRAVFDNLSIDPINISCIFIIPYIGRVPFLYRALKLY